MTVRYDEQIRYHEVEQATEPFEPVRVASPVSQTRALRPTIAPPLRRVNNAWLFTLVAIAITTVGLLYLVQTSHVASLGYEVSRLEQERLDASLENQQLTYDIARQQSLPTIERIARDDLDMQPIDQVGTRLYITVPMPANEELPIPAPEDGADLSIGERVWARLTGTAHASNAGGGE
jgi:cell division protein FtsL